MARHADCIQTHAASTHVPTTDMPLTLLLWGLSPVVHTIRCIDRVSDRSLGGYHIKEFAG